MRIFFSISMLVSIIALIVWPLSFMFSVTGSVWLISSLFIYGDIKKEREDKKFNDAMTKYELKKKYRL